MHTAIKYLFWMDLHTRASKVAMHCNGFKIIRYLLKNHSNFDCITKNMVSFTQIYSSYLLDDVGKGCVLFGETREFSANVEQSSGGLFAIPKPSSQILDASWMGRNERWQTTMYIY